MPEDTPVLWSPLAEETYLNILNYLIDNWSVNIAQQFDDKVESLLKHISKHTKLCPKSKHKDLRKCVITHQTSLIYRITSTHIELIVFIDNRSQHSY
jgi:plasmid stabilization system protein ParE